MRFFRGNPITINDLFLFDEVKGITDLLVSPKIIIAIVIAVICSILFVIGYYFFMKKKQFHHATLAFLVLTILATGLCFSPIHRSKSFILTFLMPQKPLPLVHVKKGDQVQFEQQIKNLAKTVKSDPHAPQKPNILIVQSEAFWNLNKLDITMNKNPNPYFEALRSESIYGEAVVPVFGGGTCNTEFEMLTGISLKSFYNDWYLVFPNQIDQPLPSLGGILRKQGYVSKGFHPFHSWYFNRKNVYRDLGFDEFKTIEYCGDAPKYYDTFVKDSYVTDELIRQIKTNDKPLFEMVVTMQNHGPYEFNRLEENEQVLQIETSLPKETNELLVNYANGIYISDRELGRLIDTLRTIDEPTIVLFYGDHLPMLGANYMAFRDTKYIQDEPVDQLATDLRLKSVQYIVWRNYAQESVEKPLTNIHYMGPMLLQLSGNEIPDYMKQLLALQMKYPVCNGEFLIDEKGNKYHQDTEAYALYIGYLERLMHQYFEEHFESQWVVEGNDSYNQSLNHIKIEHIEGTHLFGANLYQGGTLLINQKPVDYQWISKTHLKINTAIPGSYQFKILDSNGDAIAESNPYDGTASIEK